eukprot:TRINITY_DN28533_c0_g1_i1.p1 TRINITY_DN28533_c0_g1~~TRINITY_DN28533_c0_g1_i1.p1  ORF type:complete len:398 (+),score=47.15 TRINITY_DN28533_c0_g1_i1:128-1195(+)
MIGKLPRYIRLVKGSAIDVKAHYEKAEAVPGVPGVWKLPHDFKIHGTPPYEHGDVAGIDLGSYMAVTSLNVQPNDVVLDICCAPGAKLLFLSELTNNHITGIDNNLYRLSACRSTLSKYNRSGIRLILSDATTYNPEGRQEPWWVNGTPLCSINPAKHRKTLAKSYPDQPANMPPAGLAICDYTATRGKKQVNPAPPINYTQFDKVIVDAECTTDGSLRHVEKLIESGQDWKDRSNWAPSESVEELFILQKKLLRKGISLTKPGGTIIYSTCSLSSHQNEDVVQAILQEGNVTQVHPFEDHTTVPYDTSKALPKSVLFTPLTSNCGALFVSKFIKHTVSDDDASQTIKRPKYEVD